MQQDTVPDVGRLRTRWAAIGAAVAVVAGAGGIAVSGATSSQLVPSTTDITPCRIMDTRASSQIGPRSTPLGLGTTHTIQVTGKNGNCTIPTDATGVILNLTLANIGADGFITVYPADAPARPTASNINYGALQKPVANLVDTTLSADGRLSFYSFNGPVDLVADITAYTTGARLSTSNFAQKRWDRDRARPTAAPLSGAAGGLAFDGSALWVSNFFGGTVSRFDVATGNKVLTDIPVGAGPFGVAFDGRTIWVANSTDDSVSRVDAATGTRLLPDIAVGDGPTALVFDGVRVWVANSGGSTLSRINTLTGTKEPTDLSVGAVPNFLAFDGAVVWVLNSAASTIRRFNATTGAAVTPDLTAGSGSGSNEAFGLGYDGTTMWVANRGSDSVSRFDAATGTRLLPDITVGAGPQNPTFDGTYVWVANASDDTFSRIEAATGVRVPTDVPVTDTPNWMVFDGTSMWTTTLGLGSRLRRVAPPQERP